MIDARHDIIHAPRHVHDGRGGTKRACMWRMTQLNAKSHGEKRTRGREPDGEGESKRCRKRVRCIGETLEREREKDKEDRDDVLSTGKNPHLNSIITGGEREKSPPSTNSASTRIIQSFRNRAILNIDEGLFRRLCFVSRWRVGRMELGVPLAPCDGRYTFTSMAVV